jgi:hypothetical protein
MKNKMLKGLVGCAVALSYLAIGVWSVYAQIRAAASSDAEQPLESTGG